MTRPPCTGLRDLGDGRGDAVRLDKPKPRDGARYRVQYHHVDGCLVDPSYLALNDGDDCELIDVTDACSGWGCVADLYAHGGQHVGRVEADGSYRLTTPASMTPDADYTPITVGFDLRRHPDMAVQLPAGKWIVVRYSEGQDVRETAGTPAKVATVLRAAGYRVSDVVESGWVA